MRSLLLRKSQADFLQNVADFGLGAAAVRPLLALSFELAAAVEAAANVPHPELLGTIRQLLLTACIEAAAHFCLWTRVGLQQWS